MITAEFLLTSLIVVLIPGTGVIYTVSTGLFLGWRASIAAALGCTLGIVPHLLASILGLSAIMHLSAMAFQAIKIAGAAYLLYLAWSMWRESGSPAFEQSCGRSSTLPRIAVRGVLINILNPKLTIFFLAFLPLFLTRDVASALPQLLLLSGVFMAMTLVVFVVYGACAHSVRACITGSPRRILWAQRSFALAFASLGVKLAMTER
jgi:threonine/homoserine/homoserine lactone efflux protein